MLLSPVELEELLTGAALLLAEVADEPAAAAPEEQVMARTKRSPAQRERDLSLLSKWIAQGVSQLEMTDRLNARPPREASYTLTRQQVQYDVKSLMERWQEEQQVHISVHRARELARLLLLEGEAWEAWERSRRTTSVGRNTMEVPQQDDKGKGLVVTAAEVKAGNAPLRVGMQWTSNNVTEGPGDPRFLQLALSCVQQRVAILGLEAPRNIRLGDESAFPEHHLDDRALDVERALERIRSLSGHRTTN